MNRIKLTPSIFIAKGRDRACYYHPTQEKLCVKVALKSEKQSLREKAYLHFLERNKADLSLISQYRGEVATNLGKGYLFDLAINYDGQLSQTLKQAIQQKTLSYQEVNALLTPLKRYLVDNMICVKDLSPNNLAYVKTSEHEAHLCIIDGIGNPNHNPFTIRLKPLAQKAINNTWARLERKVTKLYQPNTNAQPRQNRAKKTNRSLTLFALLTTILITSFSLLTAE